MYFLVFLWNVQGASSPRFRRAFKTISCMYYPEMIILVEPHCGGLKADKFIKLSGFDRSHRVEASSFSRDI